MFVLPNYDFCAEYESKPASSFKKSSASCEGNIWRRSAESMQCCLILLFHTVLQILQSVPSVSLSTTESELPTFSTGRDAYNITSKHIRRCAYFLFLPLIFVRPVCCQKVPNLFSRLSCNEKKYIFLFFFYFISLFFTAQAVIFLVIDRLLFVLKCT